MISEERLGSTLMNSNGVPDECEDDCNLNGIPDDIDIAAGTSEDCNFSALPDECELTGNDCDTNGIPDECDTDCNTNGTPDACEAFTDCNTNAVPDECESDTDTDGFIDACDNCPVDANPDQADFDGDGEGDTCDSDIDSDGVDNASDVCDFTPPGAPVQADGGLLWCRFPACSMQARCLHHNVGRPDIDGDVRAAGIRRWA
jgi:thrombospondin 2/3/4/5